MARQKRQDVSSYLRGMRGLTGFLLGGCLLGGVAFVAWDSARSPEARAVFFANAWYGTCRDALLDGRVNIRRGEPGYRPALDRDNDGVACEPYTPQRR